MGNIRKQSILSSLLIYIGFIFGAINSYLFAKEGYFQPGEYGLTQTFISINLIFYSLAAFGMPSVISRFYPFYYDELEHKNNDLLSLAFVFALIGFILVCVGAVYFEPVVVRKFITKSPLLIKYYYWILPFTFFYLVFTLLDAHSAVNKKTVLPNFLRETVFRVLVTCLIFLYIFKVIQFDLFIKLFAFIYLLLTIILAAYLWKIDRLHFTFTISHITKKKLRDIFKLVIFIYGGIIIFNVTQNIGSIIIASNQGLAFTGIFTLSSYIASIISVPQRSIVSITSPYLSQAWKDGNTSEISRIYSRSSINLLIISLFLFFNIWLNINDAYTLFKLDPSFEAGKYVILVLGIKFIIDMGTGVNSQLLYSSPSWKFEFVSGMILLLLSIPLNYFFIKKYGMIGAAYADLISLTIYNIIRVLFIYKKYQMQPFSYKTISALLLGVSCYAAVYFLTGSMNGWLGMFVKTALFSLLFMIAVYFLKLTPDMEPVVNSIKKRLGIKTT
jgi:O-antigen/teichoic acid export membrane protein